MTNEDVKIERVAHMTSFESNNNVLKVDGIQFITLVPKQVVDIPQYGEETSMQFGVRIMNQASIPYHFDLQRFYPEILDPQGQILQMDGGQNATREVEKSDIPLLMPGESLDFLMDAKFNWYNKKCLSVSGNATYGGFWIFWNIMPGRYHIRLKYENQLVKKKMLISPKGWTEIDQFWIGKVITPFENFYLR
ncbi:hypothetical protein [Fortiea contorta]|uniref:hypothetical protein n=1 Tax=Fortiea contorta TaxID=1892405 RepID=UPI00037CD686|nr:hypothetical protein [Fortiea contorta]